MSSASEDPTNLNFFKLTGGSHASDAGRLIFTKRGEEVDDMLSSRSYTDTRTDSQQQLML
jgi:hypothetical protein